jgi:DNA-binding MarR family transcriptional regulator
VESDVRAYDPRYADLAETVLSLAREILIREAEVNEAVTLTPSNAQVMRYIDSNPGALSSEAAEATGLRRSNLSTAIRQLEKIGFIERRPDPDDRRGVRLYPTSEAARNLETVRAQWSDGVFRALRGSEGVEEATALLRRVADTFERDRRELRLRSNRPL